jgi:hypothetical protein
VTVIDFLVGGQPLGKVCDWGSLEGLSYHSQPYLPLSAHYTPIILSSSRPFDFSDPRRACTSFHGKKGLKAHRNCCWVKRYNPIYIDLPDASPKDPLRKQ